MNEVITQKRTTIYGIAKHANVSVRTITRYLNGKGYVGQDTRHRIQKVIKKFDYHPSSSARSLSRMKTMMIGVALYHADYLARCQDNFFPLLMSGLVENFGRGGYGLQILETCPEASEHKQGLYYLDRIKDASLDGLILADSSLPEQDIIDLQQYGVPFVLASRYMEALAGRCVLADDYREGYLMARFLLDRGHKSIAYFGLPVSFTEGSQAMEGIAKAVEEYGGNFRRQDVIRSGKHVIGRMMEILGREDAPTAVICATTQMSSWLVQLLRSGFHVPDGFECAGVMLDVELLPCRQLVYVSSPKGRKIGLKASELLLDMINGKEKRTKPVNVGTGSLRPLPDSMAEVLKLLEQEC